MIGRRALLQALGAGAVASLLPRSIEAAPRAVRMRWPWPVRPPRPYALDDLVSALLGATLYPTLYARALDGVIEPRLAVGMPHESKTGIRIDLGAALRPSDVVASISAARAGGASLLLRETPVPRIEGARSVMFPGTSDVDGLLRRLTSPLVGMSRMDPRGLGTTGAFDMVVDPRDGGQRLRLTRRPLAAATPGLPARSGYAPIMRFELDGDIDLATSLRDFERGQSEIAWLGDGLFAPRPSSRPIDLGVLAHVAVVAGIDGGPLRAPGAIARAIDAIAPERLDHLGLFRRATLAEPIASPPPARIADRAPILVRLSEPLLVSAAEILGRELGGQPEKLDDAAWAEAVRQGQGALSLRLIRPLEDGPDGAALALATLMGAPPPAAGVSARQLAASLPAAIGWDIMMVGAEASTVWVPRSTSGGLDLEAAGEL
jgi:hypothetical protein